MGEWEELVLMGVVNDIMGRLENRIIVSPYSRCRNGAYDLEQYLTKHFSIWIWNCIFERIVC